MRRSRLTLAAAAMVALASTHASGSGLAFTDSAVRLPGEAFDGLDDFTIELWVNGTDNVGSTLYAVLSLFVDGDANGLLIERSLDPGSQFVITHGTNQHLTLSPIVGPDEWHHVAVVREGAVLRGYVDGAYGGEMSSSFGVLVVPPDGAWLGQDQDCEGGCFTGHQSLYGMLDELRVWAHARSGAEIANTMNSTMCGNEPGLVAYWRMDDAGGQTVADRTGNGYDAELGISSEPDAMDPAWTDECPALGPCGGIGLGFANKVVQLPGAVFDGLDDFSVELWVRGILNEGSTTYAIMSVFVGTDANGLLLERLIDPGSQFQITHGTNQHLVLTPPIDPGTWYHVTIVRESGTIRGYVDGVLGGEMSSSFGALSVPSNGAWLGQDQDCEGGCFTDHQALHGMLDELRVWNYARSPEEIMESMNESLCGDEAGLVACWHMNEATGQVLADATGNGYDAQLGTSPDVDEFDPVWIDEAPDLEFCCPADQNGDGFVNVIDLLTLLVNWGPCVGDPGCLGDVNADGDVNVIDLLLVLSSWGACG